MTKTLILAVDRDDDFGEKGKVETPAIGIEAAKEAVIALGTADPEDSDVNALLAAMNIYKDLSDEGKDVEIALVCGDKKVGHKSDQAMKDELIEVLDTVKPDSAILVGDGAEDEVVYPIISSRIPIDSVRKVYVKQAPGIEGSFYIFKKMLSDPQKKKRFLVPLGVLLIAIAAIFIIIDLMSYGATKEGQYLISLSWPLVILLLGVIIVLYGYNWTDQLVDYYERWFNKIRSSSVSLTFSVLSVSMVIVGLIIGFYSIMNILDNGVLYVILVFISNVIWPFAFAIFFDDLGKVMDSYFEDRKIGRSFMTKTISVFGVALIIQGIVDFVRNYVGYNAYSNTIIFFELAVGIAFTLIASIVSTSYKKYYRKERTSQ